jgi:hypothetical protein
MLVCHHLLLASLLPCLTLDVAARNCCSCGGSGGGQLDSSMLIDFTPVSYSPTAAATILALFFACSGF